MWIDDNSVVRFIGKVFIAGKSTTLNILGLVHLDLHFSLSFEVSPRK